ncbi:MAG: 50S ribosomal protein L10 [Actinobacteria bacterium]|nr:50S ribosomal protein L10 [Actinomycetota bacterium]
MDDPRPEKVAVVEEVRGRLSASGATILTEYRGLKVAELAQLRRNVGQAGGDYRVYKNTLVRRAAQSLELEGLESLLTGPTALAFVTGDPVEVAKVLRDYARVHPALVVKGGVLGTRALSADQTRALADVPPRPVLLARLAGGLAAPMQQLAGLLQALPRNFAYGLKALVDQRSATGPGEVPTTTDTPSQESA